MKYTHFQLVLFLLLALAGSLSAQTGLYKTVSGKAAFRSDAPLEIIEAASKELSGAVDADKRTFAFSIPMQSFYGFNSALQREHFNENYMESNRFPKATFTGKIIEDLDFTQPGEHSIRAKGRLTIHGVEQERIIKVSITADRKGFTARAAFTAMLEDFQITIPRVVYQKIAEEIKITIEAVFAKP
jgi:polyisoprenoid-binding protein YceI